MQVYGSDDRRAFTRLSTTATYDIAGARQARSTTAVYPRSDFRFLELRARGVPHRRPDDQRRCESPELVRGTLRRVEREEHERDTVLTADLGFRRFPVERLALSARGRYDRPVTIAGSNERRAWVTLAHGRVARFPDSVPANEVDVGARHRYLRVPIGNGDDAPLAGINVAAFARRRRLVISDGFRPAFRLLYGNPSAQTPVYDFERLPRSALGAVAAGTLTAEQRNAAYEPPEDTRSFAARNPRVIQGALALAAIVVAAAGLLALRRLT